ncbi:hypothetical protein [Alkalicoccus halolimnae]|uniref:MerR family transcriptional regulator n=1 Tax=Alkalicoccus halolimnae TaxID=1667239 RepID=A0A5C7FQL2_9BACI|nr:hypothetical protein [Alkalicoccus halolimnae]TXF86985.1 hypothetical protein FTX54_03400 [Alkalicoccus halolimnae]
MTEDRILRTASEVSEMLQLQESTLRKYCIALEEAGHKFMKNKRGHRSFSNDDITIIQRFISAKESPAMTLKKAAFAVVSVHSDNGVTDSVPETVSRSESSELSYTMQEWKQMFLQQQQLTTQLLEKLEEQKEVEQRRMEHEQELMALLREAKEDRALPAAAQEETKPEETASDLEETEAQNEEPDEQEEADTGENATKEESGAEVNVEEQKEEEPVMYAASEETGSEENKQPYEEKKPWWMFWK